MRRLFACLCLMLACASGASSAEREVVVFAAASLTNALQEVGRHYEVSGGAKVKFSFAASSLLARQIEAGAHADVFFSADVEWMDYLAERRLIQTATRRDVLSNRLVLIAPADSKVALTIAPGFALAAALGDSRLALADPDTVPAGKYAKAALTKLRVWDTVSNKIARAENVRAAMAYVVRGETSLGIVYETDAKAEPKVRTVDMFPADTHQAIVYPVALTASGNRPDGDSLLAYMLSAKAAAVFKRHGFTVAPQ